MFGFKFYLLSTVLCTLLVLGQGDMTPPETITIDLKSTTPETTISDTTVSEDFATSTDNDTSKHKTTTTTTTTSTTTTPSTTTTTSTTTEAPTTTTTTTEAPTTPPAPTPKPGPLPPPEQGTWFYNDTKKNVTCIVVQFAGQLDVTYPKTIGNDSALGHLVLNIPTDAKVTDGSCNSTTEQWLTISWPANQTFTHNLTLFYHSNSTTKQYMLKYLNVSLAKELFVNASFGKINVELSHESEWQTPLATSYRCTPPSTLHMTAAELNVVVANFTISRLQEEAFREAPGKDFSAARECNSGDVPDAVPIAVGCALGGLVVIVLVAYLIGRRRSAARGYLSM